MLVTITTKDNQCFENVNFIELTPETIKTVRERTDGSIEITKWKRENVLHATIEQNLTGE